MGKITPLPQTRSLSALLDQPLDPVRLVRITADLAMGRLLLKHQHIKPSDSSLQMRGALWVVALLSGDRALQRPLVPLLRVRHRIISMRPYQLMLSLSDTASPYSVFLEKDPTNPNLILSYISISALPAYRTLSLEVGNPI